MAYDFLIGPQTNLESPMEFKKLLELIKPYRTLVFGSGITLILFSASGLLLPLAIRILIDDILPNKDVGMLLILLGGLAMVYAMRSVFFYTSHFLTFYACQRVLFDVRKNLVAHIQTLSMRFFHQEKTGRLVSRLISDVGRIQMMINQGLNILIVNIFAAILILFFLVLVDWQLALIAFTFMPFYFINFLYFKNKQHARQKKLQEMISEISGNLSEVLNGIQIVKTFSQESKENRRFISQFKNVFHANLNIQIRNVFCTMISEAIAIIAILLTIGAGAWKVWNGHMSVGSFVSFYSYLGMLFAPIQALSNLGPTFGDGLAGLSRISELMSVDQEVKDGERTLQHRKDWGQIQFENVNFTYGKEPIVNDFNLTIQPGQKVALVGPSGSGKSTIATLLLRFYDVTSGHITVSGSDIRTLRQGEYRKHVSAVQQEPFLFSGTILENVAYGMKDATEDEIIRACKAANAHDFIMEFPDGYQSEVGERGVGLSGGQKQRLAIARTILRDPVILVLDEATSALDNHSEKEVQHALDHLMRDRTTIVIAHRLTTIRDADLIVVMDKGHIMETGSHEKLLAQGGLYHELVMKSEGKDSTTNSNLHYLDKKRSKIA